MRRHGVVGLLGSGLLVIALTLTLTGCTTKSPLVLARPTNSPIPMPTLVDVEKITCDDIVPPEDVERYTAAGWVESQSYVDQLLEMDDPLSAFGQFGGALCAWGVPASDHVTVMGAGPIDDRTVETQKQRLEAAGFTLSDHNRAELYRLETEGGEENYLFVAGHWFYASDLATADRVRQRADVG
ncbi:hypothetical protein [Conyzicola sp.]|uniref:hypothetical protein n=1 Tax=Conyzicola sp. TaxID=1969404 RepID=UPI00398A2278